MTRRHNLHSAWLNAPRVWNADKKYHPDKLLVLAAGGVLSLILGSAILFQGGGGAVLPWPVILAATAATTLFFLVLIGAGLRAQRRPVRTGAAALVGRTGLALGRLAPAGQIRVGDEIWNAVATSAVELGTEVVITSVEGLTVRVRPGAKEASP